MIKNRDMTYTYKGFVCIDTEDNYTIKLGVMYKTEMFFMTISDHENIYEQLKPSQAVPCLVEFQDGTEPIDFIDANDNDFEDIFIWIQDLLTVSLDDDEDILQILSDVDNYEERKEFQEMYETLLISNDVIDKINIYKKYTKKWVETH